MNGRVRLSHLFVNLSEGREYRPCIIGYASRDWLGKTVIDDTDPEHKIGHNVTVQWQHHLYINLWLFELDLEWLGSISE